MHTEESLAITPRRYQASGVRPPSVKTSGCPPGGCRTGTTRTTPRTPVQSAVTRKNKVTKLQEDSFRSSRSPGFNNSGDKPLFAYRALGSKFRSMQQAGSKLRHVFIREEDVAREAHGDVNGWVFIPSSKGRSNISTPPSPPGNRPALRARGSPTPNKIGTFAARDAAEEFEPVDVLVFLERCAQLLNEAAVMDEGPFLLGDSTSCGLPSDNPPAIPSRPLEQLATTIRTTQSASPGYIAKMYAEMSTQTDPPMSVEAGNNISEDREGSCCDRDDSLMQVKRAWKAPESEAVIRVEAKASGAMKTRKSLTIGKQKKLFAKRNPKLKARKMLDRKENPQMAPNGVSKVGAGRDRPDGTGDKHIASRLVLRESMSEIREDDVRERLQDKTNVPHFMPSHKGTMSRNDFPSASEDIPDHSQNIHSVTTDSIFQPGPIRKIIIPEFDGVAGSVDKGTQMELKALRAKKLVQGGVHKPGDCC